MQRGRTWCSAKAAASTPPVAMRVGSAQTVYAAQPRPRWTVPIICISAITITFGCWSTTPRPHRAALRRIWSLARTTVLLPTPTPVPRRRAPPVCALPAALPPTWPGICTSQAVVFRGYWSTTRRLPLLIRCPTAVFGQPDFTSSACNNGGPGAAVLCAPLGLATDNVNRPVCGGSRQQPGGGIHPAAASPPPIWCLARPTFNQIGINIIKPNSLYFPAAVAIDTYSTPNHFYLADAGNSRVLGWNSLPASNVAGAARSGDWSEQ